MNETPSRQVLSVLIVEDQPEMAVNLQAAFNDSQRYDFRIVVAPTLKTYASEYHNQDFDVAILDLGMSDGQEKDGSPRLAFPLVAERVLKTPGAFILVYSGYAGDPEIVKRALQLGATDVFDKNKITTPVLVDHVELMIKKRDTRREWREKAHAHSQSHYPEIASKDKDIFVIIWDNQEAGRGDSRIAAMLDFDEKRKTNPMLPKEYEDVRACMVKIMRWEDRICE